MKIDLKIGDLVSEIDCCAPVHGKFALGIVVPFPRSFLESAPYVREAYEEGGVVWVHWPELDESNWCYVDEMRLLSENW
jgi:hypothetical protein|tara:strand:- start:4 stop:240 length:237 start_codon:yes stop_codon:yes gene_type:complete